MPATWKVGEATLLVMAWLPSLLGVLLVNSTAPVPAGTAMSRNPAPLTAFWIEVAICAAVIEAENRIWVLIGVSIVNWNLTTLPNPSFTVNASPSTRSAPAAAVIRPDARAEVTAVQSELHAPQVALPSSQASPPSTRPFPQTVGTQLAEQ
jgi:hypothetical protein